MADTANNDEKYYFSISEVAVSYTHKTLPTNSVV